MGGKTPKSEEQASHSKGYLSLLASFFTSAKETKKDIVTSDSKASSSVDSKEAKSTAVVVREPEEAAPDALAHLPRGTIDNIILGFAGWDKQAKLSDPSAVKSNRRWCLFGRDDPLPALAAENLGWGDIDGYLKIVKPNPYILNIETVATDHIDTTKGKPLVIALRWGETFIRNTGNEIFPRVLMRFIEEHFGLHEVAMQLACAQQLISEDEKKKAKEEGNDEAALKAVWDAIKKADAKIKLAENPAVVTAMAAFLEQLKKLGNTKVLDKAWEWFERDYRDFGYRNSVKNNFVTNVIIGSINRYRLRVGDLQVFDHGFYTAVHDNDVVVLRQDVRSKFGIGSPRPGAVASSLRLGSNCHLEVITGLSEGNARAALGENGVARRLNFGKLETRKKANVEELMRHPGSQLKPAPKK